MEQKINGRMLFVALLAMALTIIASFWVFHRAFDEQVRRDMSSYARLIAEAIDGKNPAELGDFAVDGLRITMIAPSGNVLFESEQHGIMDNHLTRPEIVEAVDYGAGESSRMSDTMGYKTYYYALRLDDGSVLRVAKQAQSMYSIYNRALPIMLGIGMLLLLVTVGVSTYLTRGLLRPIEKMAVNIEHIDRDVPYKELEPFVFAIKEQQLRKQEVERMRQEFTANVSHELKTPLTSISGYAEMIETGMAQADDIKDFAGKIRFEAGRLIRLIGDIIQLGRLDEKGGQRKFVQVDLRQVADSAFEYLGFAAEQAGVTLEARGPHLWVMGDRGMLEELVYNLCDNAIRYNRPGGKVVVETSAEDERAALAVIDTGIGIPTEHQTRIFERFYRVDKSRSKESGGTGLGLAIVKHIALHHGAEIKLDSAEGSGTVITVWFPSPV